MKRFIIALSILSFVGCKERGCTLPDAANYDAVAERNDESCMYQIAFWDDEDDVSSYSIWVAASDSAGAVMEFEGMITTMYHRDSLPNCANIPGALYVIRRPGIYDWEAADNNGNTLSGIVKFKESACLLQEVRL